MTVVVVLVRCLYKINLDNTRALIGVPATTDVVLSVIRLTY